MKERGTFNWLLCVSAGLFLLFSAATAQSPGSGPFQCPDGRYVLEEYLCDGDNDCRDGNRTDYYIVVAVIVISLFVLIMLMVMFAVIIYCMLRAQARSLRRIRINNTINKLDPRNTTAHNTLSPSKQQTTVAATNPLGIRPLIPTQLPTGMRPLTPTLSSAKVANTKGVQPLTLILPLSKSKPKSIPLLTPPVTPPLSKSKHKSIPLLTPPTKTSKPSPPEPNVHPKSSKVCEVPARCGSVSPLKSVTFGVADEIQPSPCPSRHSGADDDASSSPVGNGPSRPSKHGTVDAAGVPYPPGNKPPRPHKYSIGNFDEISSPIRDEHPLVSPGGVRVRVMRLEVEAEVEGRKEEESDRTRDSGLELMLARDGGRDSMTRGSSEGCPDDSSC